MKTGKGGRGEGVRGSLSLSLSLPAEVKREGGDERVSYTLWHKCTGEGGWGE